MNSALLSSQKMDWCTPQKFYDRLNAKYHFTLDPAATDNSAKCPVYYTVEDDGLSQLWEGHIVFCNPPYGRQIGKWVKKAYVESKKPNTIVVLLIPSRTDTAYWHDYIFGKADITFLRGRFEFEDENGQTIHRAPFPSAVVVFGEKCQGVHYADI